MVRRSRAYLAGAIVGSAGLAALIPLAPAIGQQSPPTAVINVELGDTATLGARGAVAFVTVFYTCTPGAEFAVVNVQLTQRSGNAIANGFGDEEVTCNGTNQAVTIPVTPSQRPFKRGVAFAQAFGSVCGGIPLQCDDDRDSEEINIERPRR